MRALIVGLGFLLLGAVLFLLVQPALAAKPYAVDGLRSVGYMFTGPDRYLRYVHCHVTDDWEIQSFAGALEPGASFSVGVPFCYPDEYEMLWPPDEGTNEDYAFVTTGRGDVEVTLTFVRRDEVRPLPIEIVPANGQAFHVRACYPSGFREYTGADGLTHYEGGTVTVTLTNIGSRRGRDIALTTYINLAGSPQFPAFCR